MKLLTVVNDMLATLGEAPLNSLVEPHEFKHAAVTKLDSANREVQSTGWWFNRSETELPVTVDGTIVLPGDTLLYRSYNPGLVRRGSFLYDSHTQSYAHTTSDRGELITLIPFEELDEIAAAYIAITAVSNFQADFDGDAVKAARLERNREKAMANLNAEETRQTGANFIDNCVSLQRIKRLRRNRY